MMPEPRERPTARELAERSGDTPMQIAGKPADICPACGCAMFVDGTRNGEAVIFRYVVCRNPACGKRFMSKQPMATLIREVKGSSSSGQTGLTVYGEAC